MYLQMSTPHQIEQMSQQIGLGLNGGFVYVGASQKVYRCDHECGGSESRVLDNGMIEAPVNLTFRVNGKPRQQWKMIVSLEGDDTYTVYLWRPVRPSYAKITRLKASNVPVIFGQVIDQTSDIYCDQLQSCIEQMYDKAIKTLNQGFIPLG